MFRVRKVISMVSGTIWECVCVCVLFSDCKSAEYAPSSSLLSHSYKVHICKNNIKVGDVSCINITTALSSCLMNILKPPLEMYCECRFINWGFSFIFFQHFLADVCKVEWGRRCESLLISSSCMFQNKLRAGTSWAPRNKRALCTQNGTAHRSPTVELVRGQSCEFL